MRWPAGTTMLPTSTTGSATRSPLPPTDHTSIPGLRSVTLTSPLGVAISVPDARQMGHGGLALGLREATVTTPSTRTDPSMSSTAPALCPLTLISNVYETPLLVSTSARRRLNAL